MRALRSITLTSTIVALTACTSTPTRTDEAFETYASALGSQDVEQMLGHYSEDARWVVNGEVVAEGRDAVQDSLEYSQNLGATMTLGDFRVEGDTVKVHVVETGGFYEIFGLPSMNQLFVFQFEDGRISSVQTAMDPQAMKTLGRNTPAFFGWLNENHPDVYAQLFTEDGRMVRSGELGGQLYQLAQQWSGQQQG